MPCESGPSYRGSSEKYNNRLILLMDELHGYGVPDPSSYRNGTLDKRIKSAPPPHEYVARSTGKMTANLCSLLQKDIIAIELRSLELQMWWRDHQEEDRARVEKELKVKKEEGDRRAALEKLSSYERGLLGL